MGCPRLQTGVILTFQTSNVAVEMATKSIPDRCANIIQTIDKNRSPSKYCIEFGADSSLNSLLVFEIIEKHFKLSYHLNCRSGVKISKMETTIINKKYKPKPDLIKSKHKK